MWLSRKAAEMDLGNSSPCKIGFVSIGGALPAIVTDGEVRSVHLAKLGGAVYVPRAGDEVVSISTSDGDEIIVGVLSGNVAAGRSEGDVLISNGNEAFICLRNDGVIELSGEVRLNGSLYVNNALYAPCEE